VSWFRDDAKLEGVRSALTADDELDGYEELVPSAQRVG
jgi:hypothetical protein